jgi:phosphate transport system substrate-binding protein
MKGVGITMKIWNSVTMIQQIGWTVSVAGILLWVGTNWAGAGLTGRILVAGYGPELPMVEELGRAFEKTHPGTAIEFEWDRNLRAAEMVRSGDAQIAVTDYEESGLKATPIAWDGIAVVVNFSNPVKELTKDQIRDLFTGKIRRWSELEGADKNVDVIHRPPDRNVRRGLESSLGIQDGYIASGSLARSDQKALSTVSGRDNAVTYVSLGEALKAMEDGVPIRILPVDKVEPGEPTVKDGRYPIRRPVLFLTAEHPDPLTEAFVAFARSPEGQKIVKKMFVPYTPPVPQHVQSSSPG